MQYLNGCRLMNKIEIYSNSYHGLELTMVYR